MVSSADSQGAEIPELLRKIDAMVRGHGGQHYEMDPEIQHAVAERRKGEEENAKARAMTVQKQRETLRSQIGKLLNILSKQNGYTCNALAYYWTSLRYLISLDSLQLLQNVLPFVHALTGLRQFASQQW